VSNREALGVLVGSFGLFFVLVWAGEFVIHNRLSVGWWVLAFGCWLVGGWLKR
jgi:hypothetical protein